nr:unnamed protein product [Callosobruchus analis]
MSGMEAYIPHVVKRPSKSKPWFNQSCRDAVTSRNQKYREWRKNPCTEIHRSFTEARNRCKLVIDSSKEDHNQKIKNKLLSCPSSTRTFWSVDNAVSQNFSYSYIPPLTREDKSIASTPKEKADTLGKLFAANSTVDFQGSSPTTIFNVSSRMAEVKFQQRDVKKILQNPNTNKASGPDQIPAIVLKRCAIELTPILCKLFRISYEQGVFPSFWKIGCVQPIPKKGKKADPNNYRPVDLLSIMSKVMETVINTQLLKYLHNNNIKHDRQYGIRKHRSTGDLHAYVTHMWNRAIENNGESRVVALDISKAFDRVWHEGLLAKLAAYGLTTGLRQWLNSFQNDQSLFVVVKGCSSDVFPINAGVPQGSVLSPTLFLLYINELLEITSNPVYSFADDSTLVSCMEPGKPLPSQETTRLRHHHASQINADIGKVVGWGLVNKVQFKIQKTQKTTLTRKSLFGLPTVEMEGRPIVESASVKLLGTNISNNMSWHDHVVSIAKTASQELGVLFRCRKLYTPEQLLLLYKAQIRPSLEYCSHVWSCAPKHSLKLLDSIQNRAIRLIDTPNLTRDLGSLEHRRKVAALSLFYRFYHGRCSRELSQIITPKAVRKNTREALRAHPYQVEVATPRTSLLQHSFFWRTSTLWNELPGIISRIHLTPGSSKVVVYKAQIRPSLKYCSDVWGFAPKHSLKLLDSIHKKIVRLIDTPILTRDLTA